MQWAGLLLLLLAAPAFAGEIALTFDDAPTPASSVMSGEKRTALLIDRLAKAKVPGALFFVTTKHLSEHSSGRLDQYAKAGHFLANHSHEHISANETAVNDFLLDAYKAHLSLKPFNNRLPLFRFPYLHEGKDPAARQQIARGLHELGYRNGYVTIDNFDWYLNARYQQAVEAGKTINRDNLRRLYLDVLWSVIEFYDAVAVKTLGRSPKHVLLLHENDLAAIYIEDLVRHIRAKGWTVISPVEAYQDPIGQIDKDFLFSKQGRVAALAHERGVDTEQLRHQSENTEYIDRLFAEYEVIAE